MYQLLEEDVVLLKMLFELEDLNEEDGYSKSEIMEALNKSSKLDMKIVNQVRNYVMDKNLEYGFNNDEPNELGYSTEELSDRLHLALENKIK